ncbi:uncharacterized protein LOC107630900 isoform X2 [Arachis ipaensis]|uniref:uncharacterized protein LOC107630900 isoform X2 n=1 Tax=Arachis ipaensis TaxID=130454 RepID=UPI000A2B2301|nr:uncharacterized protein LOC107630900 isoform X2 [Arachis ipaensis]XP_025628935.1 uncharacterized protein LOC112722182 isoform X2 [Arachis hypogaea]
MYIYVEDFTRVAFLELLGGIVVLEKFDALHIGHRELAIQTSRASPPFLLSFVGMTKVLGWNLGKIQRQSSGMDLRSMGAEGSCNPPKIRQNVSASANISSIALQSNSTNSAPLKRTTSWSFDEKLLIQTLCKVLL